MISFLYEVYQTQEQMTQFDFERASENVRISHIGFDEYRPVDYNITEGTLSNGDVESLARNDELYLVVQSPDVGTSNQTKTHFPSTGSVSYGSWVNGFLPTSVESNDGDRFEAQSALQRGQTRYLHNETISANELECRKWTIEEPDMASPASVDSGWVNESGLYSLADFTSERLNVPTIGAGPWNFQFWARLYNRTGEPEAHLQVEVVKRTSRRSESIVASNGSEPLQLGDSFSDVSFLVDFPLTTLSETDSIVIKVYANFTKADPANEGVVYLRFDSPSARSGVATTIAQRQTVETKFVFSQINAERPARLDFTIIGRYSVGSVSVTVQLWDYTLDGGANWSTATQAMYVSDPTPETDEVRKIPIAGVQETWRYLHDGVARVRVKGTRQDTAQPFLLGIDLVKLEYPVIATEWYSVFLINQDSTDVNGLDITWAGHCNSTMVDQTLCIYDFSRTQWDVVGSSKISTSELRVGPLRFNTSVQDHVNTTPTGEGEVWLSVNCTSADPCCVSTDSFLLKTYPASENEGCVAIELVNEGGLTVHLVRLWIVNETNHLVLDATTDPSFDVYLAPSESYVHVLPLPYSWIEPETYVFKVISERGNLWTGSARTG